MTKKRAGTWHAANAVTVLLVALTCPAGTASAEPPLPPVHAGSDDVRTSATRMIPSESSTEAIAPQDREKQRAQEQSKQREQDRARQRAQEEARKRAQEEARRKAQQEAQKKAAEEARRRAQEEARQRAAQQARERAQQEARERAAQQARERAQQEARERAAQQARERAQQEARERAAQQARDRAQQEARERAAQQTRDRAQQEARERAAQQARERAQQEARERAAQQTRERAQQEARERAAQQARERAQQEARERAAQQTRDRAQQEARERAAQQTRDRAQQEARERAAQQARDRAQQEARERAANEARQRAESREREIDAATPPVRTSPPPRTSQNDTTTGNDRTNNSRAIERAVESARERAAEQLERERAAAAAREESGTIRITPRREGESLEPIERGTVRITPGTTGTPGSRSSSSGNERVEVLHSTPRTSMPMTARELTENARREVQREAERQREEINAGRTLPTRRHVEASRGSSTGGTLPGDDGPLSYPGSGPSITQPQGPIERIAAHQSYGSSPRNDGGERRRDRDDDRIDIDIDIDIDFDFDLGHHHDYYRHRHHRSYRDFCDDYGYRRYRFYDRWGYDRSCSPWFSYHLFYGYRWRSYCDPYWDWWIRPGFSFRFYYDYGTPSFYRPWYTDVRYVTTYQTVYRTDVQYVEVPVPTPPPALTADDAWQLVSEGYYREARSAFSRLSIQQPDDGTLRIGYAIASGLEFDAGAAVFAMRRALELDPISVRFVPVDDILRRRVLDLVDHFAAESRRNEFDRDAIFMVAALNTVLGEDGLAFFAIDRAIDLGDDSTSTYNLESIIRQRMEDRLGR